MAEKTEVMSAVISNPLFRNRVRAISVIKAQAILEEGTPDAGELAWAKLAVASGYDAWCESALILSDASPATSQAAYGANDATYATVLNAVLPAVILAKGL